MDAVAMTEKKPHAICIPFPEQSHVKCMLKLAELLHHKGLEITFINAKFIHDRFLKSAGEHCLDGSPGFRFETIPDNSGATGVQLVRSIKTGYLAPVIDILTNLPNPPSCIISDGLMSAFTIDAAQRCRIPLMLFWTLAASGFMGLYQT